MTEPERADPEVIANDGQSITYSSARIMWENGEFSDWVEQHGFPLDIDGDMFSDWTGVEDALSDDSWDD